MRQHGGQANALIETLHSVNEAFGYLGKDSLRYVAMALKVPLSRVYGVATFYHYFTLEPPGKHTCVICVGTACYIRGAKNLLTAIEQMSHITPGQTSPDGQFSLVTARCLGSCGLAPNGVFDGEVTGKLTPTEVSKRVNGWLKNES